MPHSTTPGNFEIQHANWCYLGQLKKKKIQNIIAVFPLYIFSRGHWVKVIFLAIFCKINQGNIAKWDPLNFAQGVFHHLKGSYTLIWGLTETLLQAPILMDFRPLKIIFLFSHHRPSRFLLLAPPYNFIVLFFISIKHYTACMLYFGATIIKVANEFRSSSYFDDESTLYRKWLHWTPDDSKAGIHDHQYLVLKEKNPPSRPKFWKQK